MTRLGQLTDATFQAILHNLDIQDHASLRLVSHAILVLTNQHVPHVSLRLCDSSNAQQLQQWCQATRNLRHVGSLHMQVAGNITAEVFDTAMQLLSQHMHITELHILGVMRVDSTVQSLLPLKHLLPHLQTLVIDDIDAPNMDSDLKQLSAAAAGATVQGWQLQSLALKAFPAAVCDLSVALNMSMLLPMVFPNLQQLVLQLPGIEYPGDHTCGFIEQVEADAKVAVVANILLSALSLKRLHTLRLSGLPDVWQPLGYVDRKQSAVAAAAGVADMAARAAALRVSVNAAQGVLPSMLATPSAAEALVAAVFATLDNYGCWLLKHHETLQELHIETEHQAPCISWQQQQQQQQEGPCRTDSSTITYITSPADSTAAQLLAVDTKWSTSRTPPELVWLAIADDANSSSSDESLTSRFQRYMSHYIPRPASSWMDLISRLSIGVYHHEVDSLVQLLGNLKSLRHLAIDVTDDVDAPPQSPAATAAAAVKAAATVQQLQFLGLLFWDKQFHQVPDDLLLPLTAAAGGPGSSLKKLFLHGNLTENADVEPAWLGALKQLHGLEELGLTHRDHIRMHTGTPGVAKSCIISVGCLPNTLKALRGWNLHLVPATAAAADAEDVGSSRQLTETISSEPQLQLQRLHLTRCLLSSPSILASNELQQLTIHGNSSCSWSGGWAASAAAWPNVRRLEWNCDCDHQDLTSRLNRFIAAKQAGSSNSSDRTADMQIHADALRAERIFIRGSLQDILTNFTCLDSLFIQNLHCLSGAALNLIVQQKQIKVVSFEIARCVQLAGMSSFPLAQLQLENNSSSGNNSNNSSSSSIAPEVQALLIWLQQQLPWASIGIRRSCHWLLQLKD